MTDQTLAHIFDTSELKTKSIGLVKDEAVRQASKQATAESIEKTSKLINSLVESSIDQVLNVSLADILLGAFKRLRAIQEFSQGEKLATDKAHSYLLAEQKIQSKHSPTIELLVFDNVVTEIVIDITLTLILAKIHLLIQKGRIREIQITGCQAKGKLTCHGQTLLDKKSAEFIFPSVIQFEPGIKIPPPLSTVDQPGSVISG